MVFSNRHSRLAALAAALAGALGATTAPAGAAPRLVINGKIVSTDVRTINGSAYVKLADVAKALGMVVVKRADGSYEIKKPGGTNPIKGVTQGKIKDVLFDGKWRFQVLSVQTPESYTMKTEAEPGEGYYAGNLVQWNSTTRTFMPGRGYQLVVLQCRVTNAVAQKRTLWVGDKNTNTALTDTHGESHPAVAHDFEGAPIQSKPLLQGAKLDFNLVFSVPQGTQKKDLVFTLVANGDLENPRDVRVALTE